MIVVRFPAITSFEMKLEKIAVKGLKLPLILEGSKIYAKDIFDGKESKN